MHTKTRLAYNAYLDQLAALNQVPSATEKFTVEPSVQQKMETKIQDSSSFLKSINVYGVPDKEGEKIGLGIGGSIASTTDTRVKARTTSDLSTMDSFKYRAEQTNFDSHVTYAQLDNWARHPNFQIKLRDLLLLRQALDRIKIGFNGVRRAATSDRNAHPMLDDVNIGWLQHLRTNAPQRVMDHGAAAGKIKVGAGGDYENIDALVFDAKGNLLDEWYKRDTMLVVICGSDLVHDKYFPLINQTQPNTERLAVDMIISQNRIGGVQAVNVPYFPPNAMLITRLDNVSLYYQEGSRRRTVKDCAELNCIQNFESSNEAYVLEDHGAACLIENIELV